MMPCVTPVDPLAGLLGSPFHTGSVVASIETAMGDLGPALGLDWAPVVQRTGPIHTPAGLRDRDMLITYSRGPGHQLELIEYLDDTAYRAMSSLPLHHLGFWTDDFLGSIDALGALGMPSEAAGAGPDGERCEFSYHLNPHSGLWIEIVDAASRDAIARWTAPLS